MSVKRKDTILKNASKDSDGLIDFSDFPSAECTFKYFEQISKIPRCSGNRTPIADYLVDFAKEFGLAYYRDDAENVIIRKPASEGYEEHPTVILQGHTDMVKQCVSDCEINMDADGVRLVRHGDTLCAVGG